jgi:putative toxin-antitoxin system antitoxin component (TIGR02293 family)
MASTELNIEGKLNKEISSFLKHSIHNKFHLEKGKSITYKEFLGDKMLIIAAIRVGIPYSLFDLIQYYTPFSENDWASLLDISTKSLQRYKVASQHHFRPNHSEKIIEMAEVTNMGLETFGSFEKLKLWLNTPNFALGNLKPFELLKDSYGKELVMNELVHINHGILV